MFKYTLSLMSVFCLFFQCYINKDNPCVNGLRKMADISKATSSRGVAVHEGWMVTCRHVVAISYFDKPDIRPASCKTHCITFFRGKTERTNLSSTTPIKWH